MSSASKTPPRILSDRIRDLPPGRQAAIKRLLQKEGVDVSRLTGASHSQPALVAAARDQELPLSFEQQRVWFLHQIDPQPATFNLQTRMGLAVAPDTLGRAVNAVVARHEVLRTTYRMGANGPVQLVAPPEPFVLPIHDLSAIPDEEALAEIARVAQQQHEHPFDLETGPVWRAVAFRLRNGHAGFCMTVHHIATDGWSLARLNREILELCDAGIAGRAPRLPPLPAQYADFAVWQRAWLSGEALESQLAYWRDRLAGMPAALELHTDYPRPLAQTHNGNAVGIHLPENLATGLKLFAQGHQCTLFMVLLALFKSLLFRYTGQADVVAGMPVAGRTLPGTENIHGLFLNSLVLRTDLSRDPTFAEALARVRETVLGAFAHQDLPFEKLVEMIQARRDLSRNPLFQALFSKPIVEDANAGRRTLLQDPVRLSEGHADFDLALLVGEFSDIIELVFNFNADLFLPSTIERLAGHYVRLAEAVVADPQRRLSELELLSGEERCRLLREWNDTGQAFEEVALSRLFERQVARSPEAIGLEFEEERLSYGELNARANRLARYLRSLGVGREVKVAVLLERGVQMVVGVLGVMKAGGAYVPLDPAYPRERVAFMLEDSGAQVLLVGRGLHDGVAAGDVRVVSVEGEAEAIGRQEAGDLEEGPRAGDLAYMIYTSGSTGQPKGVQIEQGALSNFLHSMQREPGLGRADVLLAVTTLSFDIAGLELYLPLVAGGRVVLAGREVAADGAGLAALLRSSGATVMQATPATWRLLLAAGWEGDGRLKILCGGEGLPRDLAEALLKGCGELWNLYGPTETTIWSTVHRVHTGTGVVPIGRPIANTRLYILDERGQPVPVGVPGELYIGGAGLARGYWRRAQLDAERFVADVLSGEAGGRLYRTGDRARYLAQGEVEHLGRLDTQVKLRGFRIELGEIEAVLARVEGVREAVVQIREERPGDQRLVAYLVCGAEGRPGVEELRAAAGKVLPAYMVPSAYVFLEALPLTPNGKIDRKALPVPEAVAPAKEYVAPRSEVEQRIAGIWQDVLRAEKVGLHDNFFDLGGHSMLLALMQGRLREAFGEEVPLVQLFEYPTVHALAARLRGDGGDEQAPSVLYARKAREKGAALRQRRMKGEVSAAAGAPAASLEQIAVIGMDGRFPGAGDLDRFWANLCNGIESVTFFEQAQLEWAGIGPELLQNSSYVRAKAVIDGPELFDAAFFGYSPGEAEAMDPQQRLFLQCGWHALEDAGYDAGNYEGAVGVYAATSINSYSLEQIAGGRGAAQVFLNDKDFLATRLSYRLNLRGPSLTIQTACSASLVALAEACQGLLDHRCDMSIAGGVSIGVPVVSGYLHQEGGVGSRDGHCRAFDASASGSISGDGVGVVVLKRLSDALADGDTIRAVVKGWSVNNDGSLKVGFTAPSVAGQAEVITMAQALAGVEAETIGYVEAHGTGTVLGDPIEMAALTQAFRASTRKKGFCAIGAVKTNIGHLDAAAGIAGFIKTVLCVQHGQLPPSLNYERPNPKIDFAGSPFYVNTALAPWRSAPGVARRAGVSSFGLGGTNVHVILEQAPQPQPEPAQTGAQLLVLSARSAGALDAMTRRLAAHLRAHPQANLGDVSYTLQLGRKAFGHRRIVVGRDAVEVAQALEVLEPGRVHSGSGALAEGDDVVFMFSGQGTQYPQMTRDLYREHAVFRAEVDRCCEVLRAAGWDDPRALLYPEAGEQEAAASRLMRTEHAQVALFVVEYALARLWMSWGVEPAAMIGHSVGEYVAACLSGVMELEDALKLVALRGRLMQAQPGGAMLGVGLSREEIEPLLPDELSVAAVNALELCVVSGPEEAVGAFERRLSGLGHEGRRLHTSHAFHSAMMEPVLDEFTAAVGKLRLQAPSIPYVSNCTGEWISATQARDPAYWARHLRQTVEFSRGVQTLLAEKRRCFVELGPGNALCTFVRQHAGAECTVAPSVRHPREQVRDDEYALAALGRLWLGGRRMDWVRLHAGARRRRVPLPTYAFEEQRYWIDGRRRALDSEALFVKRANVADWFYVPSWKRGASLREAPGAAERWLLFGDTAGLADRLAIHLREQGDSVCVVRAGTAFARTGPAAYTIAPGAAEQYEALFSALRQEGAVPARIVHLWGVTGMTAADVGESAALERYFWSAVCIAKALGRVVPDMACEFTFVSDGLQEVTGAEALQPSKALLCGPCRVIPQEYAHVHCRSVDVEPALAAGGQLAGLVAELRAGRDAWVAHRGAHRWLRTLEPAPLEAAGGTARLRERGTYLITGALGGIGMALAEYLARTVAARLVLVGRSRLPEAAAWDAWLAAHAAEDRVSERIRRIRALEALGAEVMVAAADVTQLEQMREVVAQARRRFGAIHGAIHCAGLPAGGVIELKTLESAAEILAPKVRGTRVLAEVLQGMEPDFLVLCSSLTGLLGGAGQVDYTAANAYLDAFALAERAAGRGAVVSIAWDAWNEVGMAVEQAVPAAMAPWRKRELEAGLRSAEGVEVFRRVVASGLAQVVVSTRELLRRLEPVAPEAGAVAAPLTPEGGAVHARAELSTAYVAARNDTERAIAVLWQELLRVERVGIHDNFIELGGHSLMAIQATARLRERLGVNLTLDRFMALGTIEELAADVDALRWSAEAGRQAATQAAGERDEFDV